MEQFYTIAEVAERLKLSPRTVYRWIKQGRLQAKAFGKKYRISETEVERYIASMPDQVANTAGWGRKEA